MIYLSSTAKQEVKRWQAARRKPNSRLRLGVQTGGCSGLYYTLELDETLKADDRVYEQDELAVVVDPSSDHYLQGLTLDYSEDLMGGGFRFTNPQATATCGCGHSFSVESVAS